MINSAMSQAAADDVKEKQDIYRASPSPALPAESTKSKRFRDEEEDPEYLAPPKQAFASKCSSKQSLE